MIDEADLNHCKTATSGSYVCKQSHALMSRNSQETCAVKLPEPR